jgi:hypothetical protein
MEEENRPYRRLTIEWYKDLEAGTFLAKIIFEGEGIREGRRETVLTFSVNENVNSNLLTPSELAKILNNDSFDPLVDQLINYIGAELIRSILTETKNMSVINNFISGFITVMAEVMAKGTMVFDANKLKAMVEEDKRREPGSNKEAGEP